MLKRISLLLIVTSLMMHKIYSADIPSIKKYTLELESWHCSCQKVFPHISMDTSCALLLKQKEYPLSDDSATASSSTTTSLPLQSYINEKNKYYNMLRQVDILCEPNRACANMLRKMDANIEIIECNDDPFPSLNDSKSIFWPSMKTTKIALQHVERFHETCKELDGYCSFERICALIFMHQLKMDKAITLPKKPYNFCQEKLTERVEVLALNPNQPHISKQELYAHCLNFPFRTLHYNSSIKRPAIPSYITKYSNFIEQEIAKKTLMQSCCKIDALPSMDTTWQKVIEANIPSNLLDEMICHHHERYAPNDSKVATNNYILHGHTGDGKSSMATLFAMMYKRPLLTVHCEAIQTPNIENLSKILLPILKGNKPWVILLEAMDTLQKDVNDTQEQSNRSDVLTHLQTIADGCTNPNVILIAATDHVKDAPESLESHVKYLHIPLPDYQARHAIAEACLQEAFIAHGKDITALIASETGGILPGNPGLTCRDIEKIVKNLYFALKMQTKPGDEGLFGITPLVATEAITQQVIDRFKEQKAKAGSPVTYEGRLWQEFKNSPEFWPTIQASVTCVGLTAQVAVLCYSIYALNKSKK